MAKNREPVFTFLGHRFDTRRGRATFYYRGPSGRHFAEKVDFDCPTPVPSSLRPLLNRALDLAMFFIGTSYYKAAPTTKIASKRPISPQLAELLNAVYQEGLSQYAFENGLKRANLAHFEPSGDQNYWRPLSYGGLGILSLQSGGKDSLLTAALLTEQKKPFRPVYVASYGQKHPAILDQLNKPLTVITRKIDLKSLKKAHGLDGHVPITYIIYSLALVQAILYQFNAVLAGIGDEGAEPHATVDDLEIRHQWSKTAVASDLLNNFIKAQISPDLEIGSLLRGKSELEIAGEFVEKCWDKFGHSFSSCNVANYKQSHDNHDLHWCSNCAKCANAFLLFAPFLPAEELKTVIGGGGDLFQKPTLTETYKGLLGIDGVMKPFECVGEIAELREAYRHRNTGLGPLPFEVPKA